MSQPTPDLRSFLHEIEQKFPDLFLRVKEKSRLDYTATSLVMELEARQQSPLVFFEQIGEPPTQTVANLFASRKIMAYAVGAEPASLYDRIGFALDHFIKPKKVSRGAVQEVVLAGEQADLRKLPIPVHFEQDAGAYITAGVCVARDPDTGCNNLSYARLQVKDARLMGASLHSRHHLWDYFRRSELAGRDLPMCVVIGGHPALMVAAAAKLGMDEDEYDLAGGLLGSPLELCRAKTVDVDVPANAEIVIEGYLKANRREPEGPFVEYTGYASSRSTENVFEVTAITSRADAIFVDLTPGNSSDHLNLGSVSKEALVHKRMKEALSYYSQIYYPASGTHFHCYLQINKTAEGQARQAALLLMGLDHYLKLVVVVDRDIDPSDEQAVWWAVATRMQADRDVTIIPDVVCNQLDPSSENVMSAKMIIDATFPLDVNPQRISLPGEARQTAQQIISGWTHKR